MTSFGDHFDIQWLNITPMNSRHDLFTGFLRIEHAKDVQDFITKFQDHSGCTWRIGKTSGNRIFERSVLFECLHRSPTHFGQNEVKMVEGSKYLIGDISKEKSTCIRVDEENQSCWILNERTNDIKKSDLFRHDVYRIGDSNLSFGCNATLTLHKVFAGLSKVAISWTHNHALDSYASLRKRDPSDAVKGWFMKQLSQGVPAMEALRKYVIHLFEGGTECSTTVVDILSDR